VFYVCCFTVDALPSQCVWTISSVLLIDCLSVPRLKYSLSVTVTCLSYMFSACCASMCFLCNLTEAALYMLHFLCCIIITLYLVYIISNKRISFDFCEQWYFWYAVSGIWLSNPSYQLCINVHILYQINLHTLSDTAFILFRASSRWLYLLLLNSVLNKNFLYINLINMQK